MEESLITTFSYVEPSSDDTSAVHKLSDKDLCNFDWSGQYSDSYKQAAVERLQQLGILTKNQLTNFLFENPSVYNYQIIQAYQSCPNITIENISHQARNIRFPKQGVNTTVLTVDGIYSGFIDWELFDSENTIAIRIHNNILGTYGHMISGCYPDPDMMKRVLLVALSQSLEEQYQGRRLVYFGECDGFGGCNFVKINELTNYDDISAAINSDGTPFVSYLSDCDVQITYNKRSNVSYVKVDENENVLTGDPYIDTLIISRLPMHRAESFRKYPEVGHIMNSNFYWQTKINNSFGEEVYNRLNDFFDKKEDLFIYISDIVYSPKYIRGMSRGRSLSSAPVYHYVSLFTDNDALILNTYKLIHEGVLISAKNIDYYPGTFCELLRIKAFESYKFYVDTILLGKIPEIRPQICTVIIDSEVIDFLADSYPEMLNTFELQAPLVKSNKLDTLKYMYEKGAVLDENLITGSITSGNIGITAWLMDEARIVPSVFSINAAIEEGMFDLATQIANGLDVTIPDIETIDTSKLTPDNYEKMVNRYYLAPRPSPEILTNHIWKIMSADKGDKISKLDILKRKDLIPPEAITYIFEHIKYLNSIDIITFINWLVKDNVLSKEKIIQIMNSGKIAAMKHLYEMYKIPPSSSYINDLLNDRESVNRTLTLKFLQSEGIIIINPHSKHTTNY